jgi:hypothetical protein
MVRLLEGYVASDPVDGLVDVTIPAFDDDEQEFSECVYMPRGALEPTAGVRCLVAFDEQGGAWVVAWQPD